MEYFCFNKENQEYWISPHSNQKHFINIQYAVVTFHNSFFQVSPITSGFSMSNGIGFIILNSKIINEPCDFCRFNIKKIFSVGNCNPCKFNLMEPYNKYDLPFDRKKFELNLIKNGYLKTSCSLFQKSLWRSKT